MARHASYSSIWIVVATFERANNIRLVHCGRAVTENVNRPASDTAVGIVRHLKNALPNF
jgi:hypothetical protein